LEHVRCAACGSFRNTKKKYLKAKIDEHETNRLIKNVGASVTSRRVTDLELIKERMRSVTVHLSCVGQLRFSEMRSYLHWECYMEVSQRQHSLHQCVPKKHVIDFW
jgi:hypothetical protein